MNQTQTVGRALDILFVLAESGKTLTVGEIAERVPLPESTAYRLVKTLELNGVIERREKGQISLGMRIMDLARSLHQQIDQNLLTISRPIMDSLTERLNETSLLVVRRGDVGVTVQFAEGNRLIGYLTKNGKIHQLDRGASGKSILAFENSKFINGIMKEADETFREELEHELEKIRHQGYAQTVGEVDSDTLAVAAPIFDESNSVIASLSILGPKERFPEDILNKTIDEVVKSANEITKKVKKNQIY
ncbi:IclR family transcriptional regulator [Sporosarcina soli]|uniref:IclR family transcriptional regulator n=1 Tax=Sporosarcina soli TaxID=334736 RepID=A0ABW0THK7_9BACL